MASEHGSGDVTDGLVDLRLSMAASIAGVGLLVMALVSFLSLPVIEGVAVPGDVTATATTIIEQDTQFRLAIAGVFLVIVLDVVVAWALYVFFRPVSRSLSLLAMVFRLLYAALFGAVLANLLAIVGLLDGGTAAGTLGPDRLHALIVTNYDAFLSGWDVVLGIFGIHLLLVGYLAVKAEYVPTLVGVLAAIAGLGYVVDTAGTVLIANYALEVALFTFVGEVVLLAWLLYRGRTIEQSEPVPGGV